MDSQKNTLLLLISRQLDEMIPQIEWYSSHNLSIRDKKEMQKLLQKLISLKDQLFKISEQSSNINNRKCIGYDKLLGKCNNIAGCKTSSLLCYKCEQLKLKKITNQFC